MGEEFPNSAMETFGSYSYQCHLPCSDIDIVVILGPGQSPPKFLCRLATWVASGGPFTAQRRYNQDDCLQTEFMHMPVDIKPIKHSRTSDLMCRSTDCLRHMIAQRQCREPDFEKKHQAIIIFKLLCHYLHVVQHHGQERHGSFKSITLCYWALAVLEGMPCAGKEVGDVVFILCQKFCAFRWRHWQVTASVAGDIRVRQREQDLTGVVCIMFDKSNSTTNVTEAHLKNSLNAIKWGHPEIV